MIFSCYVQDASLQELHTLIGKNITDNLLNVTFNRYFREKKITFFYFFSLKHLQIQN